jgi:hypothetical protein
MHNSRGESHVEPLVPPLRVTALSTLDMVGSGSIGRMGRVDSEGIYGRADEDAMNASATAYRGLPPAVSAAICSSPAPSIANALSGGRPRVLVARPGEAKRTQYTSRRAARVLRSPRFCGPCHGHPGPSPDLSMPSSHELLVEHPAAGDAKTYKLKCRCSRCRHTDLPH